MSRKHIKEAHRTGRLTIIRLDKSVTFDTLAEVQKDFGAVTAGHEIQNLLFDLKDVSQTDSSALAALIDLLRQMKSHHATGRVGLLNLSSGMRGLIEISKMGNYFQEYTSEEQAVRELS